MNHKASAALYGRVASLRLHPPAPGAPLRPAGSIELIARKGILGDNRYFDRPNRSFGWPNRRQVTLIARAEIAEHTVALGLQTVPPGAVRANIETLGIYLLTLLGRHIAVGDSIRPVAP